MNINRVFINNRRMVWIIVAVVFIVLLLIKYPFAVRVKVEPLQLFVWFRIAKTVRYTGYAYYEEGAHHGSTRGEDEGKQIDFLSLLRFIEIEEFESTLILTGDNLASSFQAAAAYEAIMAIFYSSYLLAQKRSVCKKRTYFDFDGNPLIILDSNFSVRGINMLIIAAIILSAKIKEKRETKNVGEN